MKPAHDPTPSWDKEIDHIESLLRRMHDWIIDEDDAALIRRCLETCKGNCQAAKANEAR